MKYSDGDGFGFSVGMRSRRRSPEYPCVSRFRQRRLLSLLMRQELYDTFDALVGESDELFYPGHLTALATAGRWEEAIAYLSRFLPSDHLLSVHGRALLHFLRVHKAIDDIVAGAPEGRAVYAALKIVFTLECVRSQGITKLRAILWSLACCTELSFRPRRHVKQGPIPGSVIVGHYLRKRRMLPSSTSSHCEVLSLESLIKAKGWMVDLVDTSLKAGKRHQGIPLQSGSNKGAPVGAVSQTNLGTSRSPARHSSESSDTDIGLKVKEWTVSLTDDRLEAWPDMSQGYLPIHRSVDKDVARVSQTIPDTLTRPSESSAFPSLTKADAPSLLQPRDFSPVTDADTTFEY